MPAQQVIAIVLDAAEPTLVRRLIDAGEMPVLADLAAGGSWSRVISTADVGSASVWPTFASGSGVLDHGVHHTWTWDPDRMRVAHEDYGRIVPWWRAVAQDGRRVLTLDIPFIPFADVEGCVEIADWGAYDRIRTTPVTRPGHVAAQVVRSVDRHPYQHDTAPPHDHPSARHLRRVAERARTGARLRGELAARLIRDEQPDLGLVVFSEAHLSSHLLWQTVEPDDPQLADLGASPGERALTEVFRACDRAIGEIAASARPGAEILVLSLHGMRSGRGLPTLLRPLLVDLGYASFPRGRALSPGQAARTAFGALKANAPNLVRQAWRSAASPAMLRAVAEPTMMGAYDWKGTRAFSLPSDQHGWVRINLAGREASGIVPADDYDAVCDEIAEALLATRTQDGRPLVKRTMRLAGGTGGPPHATLPDLVVHWDDAAHDRPVQVRDSTVRSAPDALRLTGKHANDGFLLAVGAPSQDETVALHELHRVIARGASAPSYS